jgi:tetratricopeptide (TPR) repeat protein
LPGWQAIYEELKDKNLEIITVAEDTRGAQDAGPWMTAAMLPMDAPVRSPAPSERIRLTHPALIDQEHLVSKLYNMVNVPTAVWINEQGRIVRPNETAYVDDRLKHIHGLESVPYIAALRDWAEKGEWSPYVFSEERLRERLAEQNPDSALAAAEFGLGQHLYRTGYLPEAIVHFKEAQRLNPESWNYKRQAWLLSDSRRDYGTTFREEVAKLNGKRYYPARDLPGEGEDA